MTEEEQRFFLKMRQDVKEAVSKNGIENIRGFKVTERGINANIVSIPQPQKIDLNPYGRN